MSERNILDSVLFLSNVDVGVRTRLNGSGFESSETWLTPHGRKVRKNLYPSIEEMRDSLSRDRHLALLLGGSLISLSAYYTFGHILPSVPDVSNYALANVGNLDINNAASLPHYLDNVRIAMAEPFKLIVASYGALLADYIGFQFLRRSRLSERKLGALKDMRNVS